MTCQSHGLSHSVRRQQSGEGVEGRLTLPAARLTQSRTSASELAFPPVGTSFQSVVACRGWPLDGGEIEKVQGVGQDRVSKPKNSVVLSMIAAQALRQILPSAVTLAGLKKLSIVCLRSDY